ncbi:acyltransferase [Dyadobacter sp. CY326]|uniref:acyltransferase family protein n=1 Tax=Dyadobacter sp. CY326 TaxID=2907300 RepID=UPI001F40770F|nr:acyltransferase [Dyadobacter sp. CY326]MCE7066935.1 acyltransferase [Dyadobacter sp. CY326]
MSVSPSAKVSEQPQSKIVYIDYLKVLLTALVILHHAFVTYGAPGGWYYFEKTTIKGVVLAMTMFVSVNQSFFMGFFFFLSALFIPASYKKKGAAVFLKDRLFRLGIPLLFYSFILATVMNYLVYYYAGQHDITFLQFISGYDGWINVGVLWFVVALLLFSFCYVIWKKVVQREPIAWKLPTAKQILLFGAGVGAISFLVRLIFPIGWVLDPVGFQLGHFPQYIFAFIFGIIAAENKWVAQIDEQYKRLPVIVLCLIIFGLPAIFVVKAIFNSPLENFVGGFHKEAMLYAFWEQITGFAIMAALLAFGKKRLNKPFEFMNKMSRCAFAVYILHPFVLVCLSLLCKNWGVDPAMKLLVVGPQAVFFSFLLGYVFVKIPVVNKVV